MKKITLIGLTSLMLSTVTYGQQSPVEFGLKGGVNFASFKNEMVSDLESRTGFHAGGLAHIHLSKNWALQPEVVYSSQGVKYENDRMDKLNYVNIPVQAQYLFNNGLRLQTGPQLGFLSSSKFENAHTEGESENDIKKTDFSWTFGASYITPIRFGVDVRYNLGINNLSKINPDLQNRVWQVGVFYQFRK